MTDIVETLKEIFQRRRYGVEGEYDPDFDLFDVAADEIERLRSTIEQLRAIVGGANINRPFSEIKKEIRDGK